MTRARRKDRISGLDREGSRISAVIGARGIDPRSYTLFNPAQLIRLHELERAMLAMMKKHGLADPGSMRILEVGCGTGYWLRELIKWGARPDRLTGLDLVAERLAFARRACPPGIRLVRGNAARMPFRSGCFDAVLQFTMFTSILDPATRIAAAKEILRVLKSGGAAIWYDLRVNNPFNRDVRGIGAGEIRALFPGCGISLKPVTLAPPVTRMLAPVSPLLADALGRLPFLRTHYLGVIRKGDGKVT
jgi:SAM-dependent methyltransferase